MHSHRKTAILAVLGFGLTMLIVWLMLKWRTQSTIVVSFSSGDTITLEKIVSYDSKTLPYEETREASLLSAYLGSRTLDDYIRLFLEDEDPKLSSQQFENWRKSRDMMQKILQAGFTFNLANVEYHILVYDNVYNGAKSTETFLAKKSGSRLVPARQAENLRFKPVKDFLKRLTIEGILAIGDNTIAGKSFAEGPDRQQAIARARDLFGRARTLHGDVNADKLLAGIDALENSFDTMDRRIAAALVRPTGVHSISMHDRSVINDALRSQHAGLFAFMREKNVPAELHDDILLKVLNRQYMLAAQKIRDNSSSRNDAMYEFVMKIRELYGPVIQVFDSNTKELK